jgi:hypothetical protein
MFGTLSILLSPYGVYSVSVHAIDATSGVAQSPSRGLTISPSIKDLTLSSGLIEANSNVTVTNNTGIDLVGTISVVDFQSVGDTGGIVLGQAGLPKGKYGLANWMSLPNGNSVSLPKGQATTVKVNIENRADLAPGGHYGAVVISTSSAGAGGSNTIKFKQELTSLLFVKKLGGEQFGLQLQSLNADTVKDVPGTVTLKFGSTGNVYVVPRGYIDVTDSRGTLLSKGVINPESTLVLPETHRSFTTTLHSVSGKPLPDSYTVTAYYRYDGQASFASKSVNIVHHTSSVFFIITASVTALIVGVGIYKYRTQPKFTRHHRRR